MENDKTRFKDYSHDKGRRVWLCFLDNLKEVDAQESTLRFWQEIYDDQGKLVEVHEKYPVDKGHQKV